MSKICQFCKRNFKNTSSLNKHQKTAIYCLSLRNIENTNKFMCEICDKTFSLKDSFKKHIFTCHSYPGIIKLKNLNTKYLNDINILENSLSQCKNENIILSRHLKDREDRIKELEKQIQEIALKAVSRPTTTNKTQINNYIQNMEPISSEHMIQQAQNLTLEHIQKGASGYAEYALEYPLKDRIVCVDYSRRKIKFKNKDGELISDPEMSKLAPMFFDSIKNKSSEIVYSQNDPNMDSVMFEAVAKLFNTNSDVKNGAEGIKTEFYHDFIKHVCSGSVVE